MGWFIIALVGVLLVHAVIAAYLWRSVQNRHDASHRSAAIGVLIRFVAIPLLFVVILLWTALSTHEPGDTVEWTITVALIAYLAYLSLSAVAFGLSLMRDQRP